MGREEEEFQKLIDEAVAEPKPFAEQPGLPAVQQKKAEARKAKVKPNTRMFYTEENGKVLQKIVKPNGVFTGAYIGTAKNAKEKNEILNAKKRWISEGLWVESHESKEKFKVVMAELASAKPIKPKK